MMIIVIIIVITTIQRSEWAEAAVNGAKASEEAQLRSRERNKKPEKEGSKEEKNLMRSVSSLLPPFIPFESAPNLSNSTSPPAPTAFQSWGNWALPLRDWIRRMRLVCASSSRPTEAVIGKGAGFRAWPCWRWSNPSWRSAERGRDRRQSESREVRKWRYVELFVRGFCSLNEPLYGQSLSWIYWFCCVFVLSSNGFFGKRFYFYRECLFVA